MAKRRRPGETYATDVPRIRDWITYDLIPGEIARLEAWVDENPAQRQMDQASLMTCRADIAALTAPSAELWWVTASMARLAAEAAPGMPEWTPGAARPSRSGLVMWAHGSGLEYDRAQVIGAAWLSTDEGQMVVTPITDDGTGPCGASYRAERAAVWGDQHERLNPPIADRLWQILGATWLLAQSPTVGVVRGVKYWARDPDRPFAKPSMPGLITQVTLREMEYGAPEINGQKRGALTHQHIVRGHWRQQACGPKRAWRKPTYIGPYIKGPDGTPLASSKPTVHVWRR